MENFAVIDLGSNSVRMTISRISNDGTYDTVAEEKQYVRLSENMGAEKKFSNQMQLSGQSRP